MKGMISSEKKFFESKNSAFKPEILSFGMLISWFHRKYPEDTGFACALIVLFYLLGHYILWVYNRRKAQKMQAEILRKPFVK